MNARHRPNAYTCTVQSGIDCETVPQFNRFSWKTSDCYPSILFDFAFLFVCFLSLNLMVRSLFCCCCVAFLLIYLMWKLFISHYIVLFVFYGLKFNKKKCSTTTFIMFMYSTYVYFVSIVDRPAFYCRQLIERATNKLPWCPFVGNAVNFNWLKSHKRLHQVLNGWFVLSSACSEESCIESNHSVFLFSSYPITKLDRFFVNICYTRCDCIEFIASNVWRNPKNSRNEFSVDQIRCAHIEHSRKTIKLRVNWIRRYVHAPWLRLKSFSVCDLHAGRRRHTRPCSILFTFHSCQIRHWFCFVSTLFSRSMFAKTTTTPTTTTKKTNRTIKAERMNHSICQLNECVRECICIFQFLQNSRR